MGWSRGRRKKRKTAVGDSYHPGQKEPAKIENCRHHQRRFSRNCRWCTRPASAASGNHRKPGDAMSPRGEFKGAGIRAREAFAAAGVSAEKRSIRRNRYSLGRPPGRERGSLMVLLSWVLVALSLIALSFSRSVRMEVKATVNEVDLKQSYYIARSGIYYGINRALLRALRPTTGEPAAQQ